MQTPQTDLAIIGAGPIGIELAVAAKKAGMDYLHFDAKQIGHTISWFAPQTKFFSSNERIGIAGVPLNTPDQTKATREQYLAYLRTIVQFYHLEINTYEPLVGIERQPDGFALTTAAREGHRRYLARHVVLCTGGTHHPRKLDIPGENLPHVHHYFQDPHDYFNQDILIVGGKNSAVEAALRTHHAGARVSISYRKSELPADSIKYWLMPEIKDLFKTGRIQSYFDTRPTEITPSHVTLRHHDGRTSNVKADFVLALIGYEQDNTLFKLAGVNLVGENEAPAFDEKTMETNIPRLYVAGTATGGTQRKYTVFIENCHVHVERIIAALTHHAPPPTPAPLAQPEA
jgi:thioredoxin reductase (NADPH)